MFRVFKMMYKYLTWIILIKVYTSEAEDLAAYENHGEATKIFEEIFNKRLYVIDLLPNCVNYNVTPIVKVDLAVRAILDVDEPRQIVTANMWLRWIWDDCRLRWNKTEFGGVNSILVSAKRVWIPDIELYDSGDNSAGTGFQNIYNQRVTVLSNGTVKLLSPTIIKFTCKMNVAYFPFDHQVCKLKFASWSYTGHELDVVNVTTEADMSLFVDNGEWNVVKVPVLRRVLKYPCCVEPFPEVTFFFIMRRQVLFYMFNLVMPCMLITTVGLLVFWMPPDSGEKVSLGVTVLLSLVVFLLIVSDKLPATSDTVPMIAFYFACTIILISVSCAIAVLVWNLHNMGSHGTVVPMWLRKIAKCLAKCLCVQYKYANCSTTQENDSGLIYYPYSVSDGIEQCHKRLPTYNALGKCNLYSKSRAVNNENTTTLKHDVDHVEAIHSILQRLEAKQRADEKELSNIEEWKLIALIVDRLGFLLIFTISILIACILFVNGYLRSIDIPATPF